MPVPNTNTSLSDIQTEYGGSNPIEISEYYSNGPLVPSAAPAPNGPIPSSGQISIGQFRGSENLSFIQATGGTVTTSGDFKIHTFTSGGTFCVSAVGTNPACNVVDFLVVAGGGGGGGPPSFGGGGGGGGFRESPGSKGGSYSTSPKAGGSALPVSAQGYPVSVGGGGSNSSFSTITSARGGSGGSANFDPGNPGGCGGGGRRNTGGSGNVPPVSPPQGSNGGNGPPNPDATLYGSAGGGATGTGGLAHQAGGSGATTSATGSSTTYSVGGHGAAPGTVTPTPANSANGGTKSGGGASGIVVIRYKYQQS